MPDSYSANLGFTLQAAGDANWGTTANGIFSQLDAYLPLYGMAVSTAEYPTSTTLNVYVAKGKLRLARTGLRVTVAASTLTCTASATNYVYVTEDGTLHVNTTGFPSDGSFFFPLATVLAGTATITSITDERAVFTSMGAASYSTMGASGTSHAGGLVPDPGSTAGTTRFLREDATWATPATFGASGASHKAGYVPDPGSGAGTSRFLCENATWATPPTFVASGASHAAGYVPDPGSTAGTSRYLREDASWAALPTMVASGASHAAGLAPDPGSTAGTTHYLREDATWASLPALVGSGVGHAAGLAPDPGSTAGTTRFLREDASWAVPPTFVASGASHAPGYVPDPGSTAGTAKFLREDATWATTPGSALGTYVVTGQTAAVSTQTIFNTGSGGGLFEVCVYVVITTIGTSGNLTVTLNWTDDTLLGSTGQVCSVTITGKNYAQGTFIVEGPSGFAQNVSVTTAYTGTAGSCAYSLYCFGRRLI